MIECGHENLSVADLSGPCAGRDDFDRLVYLLGGHGNLNAKFGKNIHGILRTAVNFRVSLL